MFKILFNDKMSIKTYEDGHIEEYPCDFYNNYIDTARKLSSENEWKTQGFGAQFRGDVATTVDSEDTIYANSYFNSLRFSSSKDDIIYSATVGDISGILNKNLIAEKDSESHVIHSREFMFVGADLNKDKTKIVTSLKENYYNSHIAVYDLNTNDYQTLTDGDSCEYDCCYSTRNDNYVLFSAKGVGRTPEGEFAEYSDSTINVLNVSSGEINELISCNKISFVKPKDDAQGNLYYIQKPIKDEGRSLGQVLLDIILIPWRLLLAIYYFFETFTIIFTGKGFSKNSGNNPAKVMDKNPKQIFIEGNLINAETEYKNNLKHKDNFAGIAPWSWQLIMQTPKGEKYLIKNGVIDYDVTENGDIVITNGKHILLVSKQDGSIKKIADATLCTKVYCFKN